MKVCFRCKLPKDLNQFVKNTQALDGKHSWCRQCTKLYNAQKALERGGQPLLPFLERLWGNIQYCEHGETCPYCCWPWMKSQFKKGYGRITVGSKERKTSIVVTTAIYEIWHAKPIPKELLVLHYCDNRACCSPFHLWLGTQKENIQDAVKKGRMAKGLRHGTKTKPEAYPPKHGTYNHNARLTDDVVGALRARSRREYINPRIVAESLGVNRTTIAKILRGDTWKHVQ
jgi:hypothetical protein